MLTWETTRGRKMTDYILEGTPIQISEAKKGETIHGLLQDNSPTLKICAYCKKEPITPPRYKYCSKECVDGSVRERERSKPYVEYRRRYGSIRKQRPGIRARTNMLQNKRLKVKRLARKANCAICKEKICELHLRKYCSGCSPKNKEKGICKECGINKIGHGRNTYCEPCATDPEIKKERERMYGRKNYHKYKEEKYLRSAMSPGEALVRRLRTAVRGVVRRYLADGEVRAYGCFKHLPYTPVEFIDSLAKDWPNGFPKDMENYHIDHVIPVNHYKEKGELETMEGIMKCFALENLRLISAFDNLSKGKKVI